MSEYQCYEFLALDRPLTAQEMAELRSISTRAEITPTRFWNEYQWGDLKADPSKLLARYFDMHLYFANWGTRRLMFRLPVTAVDLDALRAYAPGGPMMLTTTGEHAVLDLWSEVEEPEDDWFEAGHLAASLTPLRSELLRGDRRVAYVAWLLAVQAGEVDAGASEPSPPPGPQAPPELIHEDTLPGGHATGGRWIGQRRRAVGGGQPTDHLRRGWRGRRRGPRPGRRGRPAGCLTRWPERTLVRRR